MINVRSIFSIALALVLTLVLNLGNAAEAKKLAPKPPTYTSEQIAAIQEYTADISAVKDRLPELAKLIQEQDWTYVKNFIRGPMGEIRTKMLGAARNLPPEAQKQARAAAKLVADNLIAIDMAADNRDYKLAIRNYGETVRDIDAFLQLLPQG